MDDAQHEAYGAMIHRGKVEERTSKMSEFKTADQIEIDALKGEVSRLLSECTEKQVEFFHRIYPAGVSDIQHDQLRNAIGLCQRTIVKNSKMTSGG